MSKTKNTRKTGVEEEIDDDSCSGNEGKKKPNKAGKKSKPVAKANSKVSKFKNVSDSDDDSDSDVPIRPVKSKFQSGFALLGDDGDDVGSGIDTPSEEEEEVKSKPKQPVAKKMEEKKPNKKAKKNKKKQDMDEDLDKVLAELKMADEKGDVEEEEEPPVKMEVTNGTLKSSKKKKKGKVASVEKEDAEEKLENKEDAEAEEPATKDEEPDEQETVKSDGPGQMKTAAQKRKEKKEREKQKKFADKKMVAKEEETTPSPEPAEEQAEVPPADATEESEQAEVPPADATEESGEAPQTPTEDQPESAKDEESIKEDESKSDAGAAPSKADKKKKKGEKVKEDKSKKGKLGNKQLLLLKEALQKQKEEAERLEREEEERSIAEEEAEKRREEQLRLDKEAKERKKQAEKEKVERLKAEGKFLTKAQKDKMARFKAQMESLIAQGIKVPGMESANERAKPVSDRPKKPKKEKKVIEKDVSPPKEEPMEIIPTPPPVEEEKKEEDDVKDSWDQESSEEEKAASESEEEKNNVDGSDSQSSDSSSDSEPEIKYSSERLREKVLARIHKRREDNESNRSQDKLRSPVVCVLGHVDTGKTKILDKIRHTHVQDQEAGGITQQIGATFVPPDAIRDQAKMIKHFSEIELKVPGLLIIDTPGHESFSNLRSRGSSLCDIAILVVDIMHGLEPQTIESINLLKTKKTPFVVALNKVDRLYEWKCNKNKDIKDVIKVQEKNTQIEFDRRTKEIIVEFAQQGLNARLFYENDDLRSFISMVPTSAATGDGMGNLISLVTELTQTMLAKRLAFSEELQATVLEVKALPGLGTTIDIILVNGRLKEGDTMIIAGTDGPIVTQIRSLLMPQPLKELRVKNQYVEYKMVEAAQGIKLTGKDLEKVIAGLNLLIAHHPDEVEICKEEVAKDLHRAMSSIKLADRGVYVQASTLGSLEALLEFLKQSNIPYAGIRIGPVVKKDVMKASIMLEHDAQYAVILAFDVKTERDAQDLADSLNVLIFSADIIYHLFDKFTAYREDLKQKKREELKNVAVFPCKLRILPQFIFNSRDPIVLGVSIEAGVLKEGTPICVPSKENLEIGVVTTIEINHKQIDTARKGQEVCIKIEAAGDSPKMYGRHFDHTDTLVSKITRQSIDVCKEYFRDDLAKTDWQLMVELKKMFEIL